MAYYPEHYISLTGPYHGPGPIAEPPKPKRTGGVIQPDGLTRFEITDPYSKRVYYEYEGHPSQWMNNFKAIGYIQDRINNNPKPLYANGGRAK